MAKKVILGTDIARDAFKTKINENFTELYDKDVALETQINDLDAEVNGKLNKNGDEMNGILRLNQTYFNLLNIRHNGAVNNTLRINTHINQGSTSATVVEFIGYDGSNPIHIILKFYLPTDMNLSNLIATYVNTYQPEIKLAVVNGEVIISINTANNYPVVNVAKVISPVPITQKWDYTDELLAEGTVYTVPYVD